MCFQLSYTLFQCLASWDANNLYIFLSQIHLHWKFDILNTIPNTSSNILLLYHTCLEVQTFIHREDHVKTPKLKVHFRSRRSAQIKLKKKQNLILKFRGTMPPPPSPNHLKGKFLKQLVLFWNDWERIQSKWMPELIKYYFSLYGNIFRTSEWTWYTKNDLVISPFSPSMFRNIH